MPWKKKDRSRYPRTEDGVRVLFWQIGKPEPESRDILARELSRGQALNRSHSGLCFQGKEKVISGSILGITMSGGELQKELFSVGRVVWIRALSGSQRYLVGVQFELVGSKSHGIEAIVKRSGRQ